MILKIKVIHNGELHKPGSSAHELPDSVIEDLKQSGLIEFTGNDSHTANQKPVIITNMSDLQKLDAKEIISAVPNLNEQQLIELNELEAADKGRKTVIKAIDEALSAE